MGPDQDPGPIVAHAIPSLPAGFRPTYAGPAGETESDRQVTPAPAGRFASRRTGIR